MLLEKWALLILLKWVTNCTVELYNQNQKWTWREDMGSWGCEKSIPRFWTGRALKSHLAGEGRWQWQVSLCACPPPPTATSICMVPRRKGRRTRRVGRNFFKQSSSSVSHQRSETKSSRWGPGICTFHASGVIPGQPLWDLLTSLTNLTLQNKKLGSREVKRHHEQQSPDGKLESRAPSSLLLTLCEVHNQPKQ